jgi:hypothetical protein
MSQADSWKVCSICRTPILHGAQYFLCSVSTCRSKRTGLFFCSLPCFEAHLPTLRHRDAWAEQERAPTQAQAAAEAAKSAAEPAASMTEEAPRRRIVGAAPELPEEDAKDVLVVVSKLKKFVRDRSGMNTSDSAVSVLSDHLRWLSIEALRQAAADGRKTVMDRDFEAVLKALKRPQL